MAENEKQAENQVAVEAQKQAAPVASEAKATSRV
jgi:hypothetical protein